MLHIKEKMLRGLYNMRMDNDGSNFMERGGFPKEQV